MSTKGHAHRRADLSAAPPEGSIDVLRAVLRRGLPADPGLDPAVVANISSVAARLTGAETAPETLLVLDAVIAQLVKRMPTAAQVQALQRLFGIERHLRRTTLTERRKAAAAALSYEYHHFRLRVESQLLIEFARILEIDGARALRRSSEVRPASVASGRQPDLHAALPVTQRVDRTYRPVDQASQEVAIVSDDSIVRSGVAVTLSDEGVRVRSALPHRIAWDEVDLAGVITLVDPRSPSEVDRYRGVRTIAKVASGPDAGPVVVLATGQVDPLVRLRFVEAGASFLVDSSVLGFESSDAVRVDDLSESLRLETRWALRQELGLHWDGDLAEYLNEATTVAPGAWSNHGAAAQLTRRQVLKLRQLALKLGGLPSPDFRRYAMALRTPPEFPEWRAVISFTRRALGLEVVACTEERCAARLSPTTLPRLGPAEGTRDRRETPWGG